MGAFAQGLSQSESQGPGQEPRRLPEKYLRPPLFGPQFQGEGADPAAAAALAAQLHPSIVEVLAKKGQPGHEERLDAAKQAVSAENLERGLARGGRMMAEAGPTILRRFIVGGGTMAALDAGTLPEGEGEVAAASLPAQVDRGGRDAGPVRMENWQTFGHKPLGQTGAELAGYKTDAAGQPLRDEAGQVQADPGFAGLKVLPGDLQEDPNQFARSSELSLATAETLRQSGVPVVPGRPVGSVALAPATPEERAAQGWPEAARARLEVELLGADGRPIVDEEGRRVTETIFTTETLDICVGPGPGNKLARSKISETDERQLEAEGDVAYAEAFLGGQGNANRENVLVFGGGATASWVVQSVLEQQAVDGAQEGEAVWAARPNAKAKPPTMEKDPNTDELRLSRFGELEKKIHDAVAQNPGSPVPAEWTAEYNGLLERHEASIVGAQREKVTTLESLLVVLPDGPEKAAKGLELDQERAKLARKELEFNPFGTENARNAGTQARVPRIDQDILRVAPTDDGKVVVTFEDGSQRRFDKVINAIGQNPSGDEGPAKLIGDLPLRPILVKRERGVAPVGLETLGGEVRVFGAAAWQLRDRIQDPTEKRDFMKYFEDRARDEVSENSKYVVLGFENMGDTPAWANHGERFVGRADEASDELTAAARREQAPPAADR